LPAASRDEGSASEQPLPHGRGSVSDDADGSGDAGGTGGAGEEAANSLAPGPWPPAPSEANSLAPGPQPPAPLTVPGPQPLAPLPVPGPWPPAPNEAFWSYSDAFLFIGLALPAMLAGLGVVRGTTAVFHLHPVAAADVIAQQFAGYFFLFLVLLMIFRLQYERPFWESLGWRSIRWSPVQIALAGWGTAIAVNVTGYLLHTPNTNNPLTDLMESRSGLILVTIFGTTLGPLAEELIFRGFFQPLLVRSLGAVAGILLTALPFGLLHFREYGNSWRHAVLICGAGVAFGCMRHVTRSTKASALMHSAYNLLFFAAVWSAKK
jgi:uncharacterized protein